MENQIGEENIYVKEKNIKENKTNFQKVIEWFKSLW